MSDETDNRCEYLSGTIGAELHCAHWHAADDAEFAGDRASAECCWCGDHEDGSGTCPGPSISRFAWCAVPSHWHDEIIGGTHDLRAWKESAMSVLAEWDRVHDALGRPGPLGRSLALNTLAEVERLSAENARLREACFEASLRLHGSLARHRDLDLDLVSYQYVTSASSLLNVALDHSGTLDDQTERWLERAKADAQPGPKHAATDLMAELEASIARVRADRAGRAAPSPSTGEDGGK